MRKEIFQTFFSGRRYNLCSSLNWILSTSVYSFWYPSKKGKQSTLFFPSVIIPISSIFTGGLRIYNFPSRQIPRPHGTYICLAKLVLVCLLCDLPGSECVRSLLGENINDQSDPVHEMSSRTSSSKEYTKGDDNLFIIFANTL